MKIKTRLLLLFILSLICSTSYAQGWTGNGWNQDLSPTSSPTFADLTLTGGMTVDSDGTFGAGQGYAFGDGDTELYENTAYKIRWCSLTIILFSKIQIGW